jgi:hypothetical protein
MRRGGLPAVVTAEVYAPARGGVKVVVGAVDSRHGSG